MLRRLATFLHPVFSAPSGFNKQMDAVEARRILAIERQSDSVLQRYRQLMLINHPDTGGSSYIAAKINEAKNLLEKTK